MKAQDPPSSPTSRSLPTGLPTQYFTGDEEPTPPPQDLVDTYIENCIKDRVFERPIPVIPDP